MEDKVAAIQSFKAATDTQITEILVVIFIVLFLIVVFLVVLNFRKAIKLKFLKKLFLKSVKERGLSEKAGELLWKYSTKLGRDPFLTLEVKASFEKVVDQYVSDNPDYDEEFIRDIRKKLGFDYIPSFVPLSTTKDIEIFQNGRITLENSTFDAALYDKDEKYMYWLLMDISSVSNLKGKTLKIQFLRRDDAIYVLDGKVDEVLYEDGKVILKIPHHSEMKRIQRRQYARIEVDLPVNLGKISPENPSSIKWLSCIAKDISAGGIRICIPSSQRLSFNLTIGSEVIMSFNLDNNSIKVKGTVVNIIERKSSICYGIKFMNIKSKDESHILNYVKKEQQKLRKLARQRIG